jgi:hypothetical protein
MPAEALENQALDALETELAKIGTAPTSNWLTTPTPEITVGVPGANVPGPNLMSLYLQHARSERGDDSVGTASHRLRCTFAVWCCSTHAADGHRRMLDLLTDVRRVLLAAEQTFYETFSYGITLGASQYIGYDAYLKQGISGCALEVVIDMDLAHDGTDLVSLDSQLERTLLRVYPFSTLPQIERQSAGIAARIEPPAVIIENSLAGANKLCELRVEGSPTDFWFRSVVGADWWQFKAEIAALIGPYAGANATNTMYAGIELGTYNQVAPFPAAAANAVAQLRWNYGLGLWELVSGVGDGVTPDTIVQLVGVPSPVAGGGARARLIYDPFTRTLAGLVNGIVGAQITNPAALPQFGAFSVSPLQTGLFLTTGSNGGAVAQALFAACHCKLYDTASPAAALWY